MSSRFQVLKWNATSAYNGIDAVTLFKNTSFTNIDAVLMDTEMPVVHGETAVEALLELGCKIPIIALTSNDSFDEGVAGGLGKTLRHPILIDMMLRANKFNITPKQKLELVQTVRSHLAPVV